MSQQEAVFDHLGRLSARQLETQTDFGLAHDLYRSVFRYRDLSFGINPRLLATLIENGGSAIGVFTSDEPARLVGFSYGYPGVDSTGECYHYSQAAVVEPTMQGRGVGRMLKLAQAESVFQKGASRMRWSFDPMQARNAHFNLNSLGSIGRWFTPNFYGTDGDRMTVDWDLSTNNAVSSVASEIQLRPSPADWGIPVNSGSRTFLPIPAQVDELVQGSAEVIRAQIRGAITELLTSGATAVACDRVDRVTAVYSFATEL